MLAAILERLGAVDRKIENGASSEIFCPLISKVHISVDPVDPRLVGAGAQPRVTNLFAPFPCQKEKCGFYHRGRSLCSIPLLADLDIDPRK